MDSMLDLAAMATVRRHAAARGPSPAARGMRSCMDEKLGMHQDGSFAAYYVTGNGVSSVAAGSKVFYAGISLAAKEPLRRACKVKYPHTNMNKINECQTYLLLLMMCSQVEEDNCTP